MDPAVLRRLHGKYFVGLPSPTDRMHFVEAAKIFELKPDAVEYLKQLSTNFSGDNMSKLVATLAQDVVKKNDGKPPPKTVLSIFFFCQPVAFS